VSRGSAARAAELPLGDGRLGGKCCVPAGCGVGTPVDWSVVIVLDTNMLRKVGFPSSTTTVLALLSERTKHPLALPETVLREYLSQRRRELWTKVDAARKAIADMSGSAVAWDGQQSWQGLWTRTSQR